MAAFTDHIRVHAFKTIHDFDNFEGFEAEMIAFGESLPAIDSDTAKDPQYRILCKGTAAWAWERKATIVPYDQFVAGTRNRKHDRQDHVLKLRSQGLTYQQIADKTGWSASTIGKIIRAARTDT